MHFLALCFIISPFEPRRHQYSADMTAKSPRFNLTTSYQTNTTNCGTKALCITHVYTHTDMETCTQTNTEDTQKSNDAHTACSVERLTCTLSHKCMHYINCTLGNINLYRLYIQCTFQRASFKKAFQCFST